MSDKTNNFGELAEDIALAEELGFVIPDVPNNKLDDIDLNKLDETIWNKHRKREEHNHSTSFKKQNEQKNKEDKNKVNDNKNNTAVKQEKLKREIWDSAEKEISKERPLTVTDERIDQQLKTYSDALNESRRLIKENTTDSLLRYFQTGETRDGIHLPSIILGDDKKIQRMLAKKMQPIIEELGFGLDPVQLKRSGELMLNYRKGEYTIEFAMLDPYKRAIVFQFDFDEMERERDILFHKVKHKIKEMMERFEDTRTFLENENKSKLFKNKKVTDRLEANMRNIGSDIRKLEEQIKEINNQKELLEDIKAKVPDMEYHFKKFGISFEYVKGEQYEV